MTGLLKETKKVADLVDYYKNAAELNLSDRAVVTRAADDYCKAVDANDEVGKNQYMAVLMMKFWYQIANMQRVCKNVTLLEYGDYYDVLYRCIDVACTYRAWQNPEKNTNAQACINATIASRGKAEILYQSNLDKNRANINKSSLDKAILPSSDDHEVTLGDVIADEDTKNPGYVARSVVQMYVDEGRLVDAVILDNIAFDDSTKTVKDTKNVTVHEYSKNQAGDLEDTTKNIKVTTEIREFWAYRLVRILNGLTDDYYTNFAKKYSVNVPELKAVAQTLSTMNNQKLYRQVDGCRADLAKRYVAGMTQL